MNDRQIRLTVRLRSALRIGTGEGNAVTDGFFRRDSLGRPVIPGTALAGILRSQATRLAPRLDIPSPDDAVWKQCDALEPSPAEWEKGQPKKPCGCPVCRLFGDIQCDERDRGDGGKGRPRAEAARIWVFDAVPAAPEKASSADKDDQAGLRTDIRDGVGIDRSSGAAYSKGRIKFDHEVLPAGAEFELRLELERAATKEMADEQETLLAAVLAEWAAGRAAVGGGTGRGLGALEIKGRVEFRQLNLCDSGQFFDYLSNDDPWRDVAPEQGWFERRLKGVQGTDEALADASKRRHQAGCWAFFEADVQAEGFLVVVDPVTSAESSFDHAPILESADRDRPIVPGSSLRGVLRSQAERIARTVCSLEIVKRTAEEAERERRFRESCPACNPLVGDPTEPLASCDALLKKESGIGVPVLDTNREAEDEHLCLACRLFGSARRGSRLRVEDAAIENIDYKPIDFLAIDRFTGGGADHLKFDAAALWRPRFKVRIHLENPEPWELGWLLLALRDIHDGLATVGFGGAKGFGEVRAERWRLSLGFLTEADAKAVLDTGPNAEPIDVAPIFQGRTKEGLFHMFEVAPESAAGVLPAAEFWVKEFNSWARSKVSRSEVKPGGENLPELKTDTYFGKDAATLYPLKVDINA